MGSIKGIISELERIPNALGNDTSFPRRRPRFLEGDRVTETITGKPYVDSSLWEITDPETWEDEKDATRRSIEGNGPSQATGIEALAWYVSFHNNQRDWGIYIPLSSLPLMDDLYLRRLRIDRDRRLSLAWSILLHHEQVHFAVDYACAQFELLLRAPIRREFSSRFHSKPPLVGLPDPEPYLMIEEKCANAHMLRQIARVETKTTKTVVESFVRTQPAGYREGLEATSDKDFAASLVETLRNYFAAWAVRHHLDLGSPELNLERLVPIDDKSVLSECPIHVIDDLSQIGVASGSLRLIQRIAEIVEVPNFKKQLLKQSKEIQDNWHEKKDLVRAQIPPPPRFEKLKGWTPPTWSLRLRDGHRVHLEPPEPGEVAWRAVDIGTHTEMGHG